MSLQFIKPSVPNFVLDT